MRSCCYEKVCRRETIPGRLKRATEVDRYTVNNIYFVITLMEVKYRGDKQTD